LAGQGHSPSLTQKNSQEDLLHRKSSSKYIDSVTFKSLSQNRGQIDINSLKHQNKSVVTPCIHVKNC
jgi:hypothetical protein